MVAPYTLRWDQAFENDMKTLFSKQLIKYPHILSTSKRASIDEFPSEISVERLLRRTTIIPISLFLNNQKADDEFLYTVFV